MSRSSSTASPVVDGSGSPPIRVRGNSVSEKIENTVEEINETQRVRTQSIDSMKLEKTEEARVVAEEAKPIRSETIQEREARLRREEEARELERRRDGEEHAEMNKSTRKQTAAERAEEERKKREIRRQSKIAENNSVTKASNWAKEELAMREAEKAEAVKRKLDKAATMARELEENRKDGMTRFHLQKQKLEALEREETEKMLRAAEEKRLREEEEERARLEAEERERVAREEEEKEREEKERAEAERLAAEKAEKERVRLDEEKRLRAEEEEREQKAREEEEREEEVRRARLRAEMMQANKSGFLNKKGGSKRDERGNSKFFSRRNWNRRYFVLDGSCSMLQYYKEKVDDSISPSSRPASLGSFDLRACSITSVHTNDHGNCIRIETKGRDGFTISCESVDEAEQWLSALTLHSGQQGVDDFLEQHQYSPSGQGKKKQVKEGSSEGHNGDVDSIEEEAPPPEVI